MEWCLRMSPCVVSNRNSFRVHGRREVPLSAGVIPNGQMARKVLSPLPDFEGGCYGQREGNTDSCLQGERFESPDGEDRESRAREGRPHQLAG